MFNENKQFQFCKASTYAIVTVKLYTRKEIVMIESSIVGFHIEFYMTEIQKLAFNLPHVRTIVTHQCGNTHQEAFKHRSFLQDVLCRHNSVEHVVGSFEDQIQSE